MTDHPLIAWAVTAADRYDQAIAAGEIPEAMAAAFLASDLLAASITASQQGDSDAARWLVERAGLAASARMAALQAAEVTIPDDPSGLLPPT